MSFTGYDDWEPMRYPIPIADITTGSMRAMGVLVAGHDQSGAGQFNLYLFDSQVYLANHIGSNYLNAHVEPQKIGNTHASIVPYQGFRPLDKYLISAVGSEALWKKFSPFWGQKPTFDWGGRTVFDKSSARQYARRVGRPDSKNSGNQARVPGGLKIPAGRKFRVVRSIRPRKR